MARSYNDGGFWMRPEWFGLIAGQSDENAGKLIKQMIITVENDGNPGELPAKLAQNRVKIGMAWGTIFPKLREQILGRKNGKKGGNPAFSENGGSNPPGEPTVQTPGSNGGLEPNYNTLHNNASLSMSVCPSVSSNPADNDRQTDKQNKPFVAPQLQEVIAVYKGMYMETGEATTLAAKYWDKNKNQFHWADLKNGMSLEDSCRKFLDYERKATKSRSSEQQDGGEHSFNCDEFLSLAMKRSFDNEEPKQESAGDYHQF